MSEESSEESEHGKIKVEEELVKRERDWERCNFYCAKENRKKSSVTNFRRRSTRNLRVDEELSDLLNSPNIKNKYKILSPKMKKFLVALTSKYTIIEVSKMYGVSVNNICRWKKSCERKVGAGRKISDEEMEKKLLEWILATNYATRKQIQKKAKEFASST